MTTSESDNVEQEVDGAVRSAVTQAAALGRMVAQMREQTLQNAARREEALAAEIQRRYEAERQYARVMMSQADYDGWWNTASTERVASVVATGQAWKDKDPEIAKLASRLDDRVQARWGMRPSARIDALTPSQRRQEAQQLVAMLSLDQLDKDDPLHTLVAELNQPEPQVDQDTEPEHLQPEATHGPEAKEAEKTGQEVEPEPRPLDPEDMSPEQLADYQQALAYEAQMDREIDRELEEDRLNAGAEHSLQDFLSEYESDQVSPHTDQNSEAEHVTVELTPKERDFLLDRLSDYESEQIDRYEDLELGERDDLGGTLYDNAQRAAALRNKLRLRDMDRAPESKQVEQSRVIERSEQSSKATREQSVDEFEQLMRSNGLDEETIKARMLSERANAKSAQEAASVKPSTAGKPKNRGGLSHNRQRDTERGR